MELRCFSKSGKREKSSKRRRMREEKNKASRGVFREMKGNTNILASPRAMQKTAKKKKAERRGSSVKRPEGQSHEGEIRGTKIINRSCSSQMEELGTMPRRIVLEVRGFFHEARDEDSGEKRSLQVGRGREGRDSLPINLD